MSPISDTLRSKGTSCLASFYSARTLHIEKEDSTAIALYRTIANRGWVVVHPAPWFLLQTCSITKLVTTSAYETGSLPDFPSATMLSRLQYCIIPRRNQQDSRSEAKRLMNENVRREQSAQKIRLYQLCKGECSSPNVEHRRPRSASCAEFQPEVKVRLRPRMSRIHGVEVDA